MMNKKTAGLSFIGNVIIGFGISILNLSGLGLDAFTAMNYGVSQVLGVGLGIYQACFNLILLIPIAVFYRRALGIGTLINMFLLGYFVEIFMQIFASFQLVPAVFDTLIIKLILLAIGFIAGQQAHVTTIGVATVIFVMGTGPMVQLFRSRIMKPFLQKLRKGEE